MPTSCPISNVSRRTACCVGASSLAAILMHSQGISALAQTPSTVDTNKALIRRVFAEAVNGGSTTFISEVYVADFVDSSRAARHFPRLVGMPVSMDEFQERFPEISVTIDEVVAEQDIVAVFATWRGAHPPAGTHVVGRTQHWFQIRGGQIVKQWSAGWDWLEDRGVRRECAPANLLMTP